MLVSLVLLVYDTKRIQNVGPAAPSGEASPDDVHAAEEPTMVLVTILVVLALFSIISIALGSEDGRETTDPRQNLANWTLFVRR